MRAVRFGEMACTRDSRRKQLKNKTPRPQAWVFFWRARHGVVQRGVAFFEGSRNDRVAGVAYCTRAARRISFSASRSFFVIMATVVRSSLASASTVRGASPQKP
ncbi:MAG: hypothetical protein RLY72_1619 [Planctomycetota bacterium]